MTYSIKILLAFGLILGFMVIACTLSATNPAPEVPADVPCVASLPLGFFADWPTFDMTVIVLILVVVLFLIGDIIRNAIKTVRWVNKQVRDGDKD